MPKDILNFLFSESFKLDADEVTASIFEQMSEVEDLESKQGSLEKVLKALDYKGDVCINPEGSAQICFDDQTAYSDMMTKVLEPDALLSLAEIGWIPSYKGDDQDALAATPHFVMSFICICDPTPSDGDSIEDLEKVLKQMNEPNEEGFDGMGSDFKSDKASKKDLKVPDAKNPKPEIHDSLKEGRQKSDQTLANDAKHVVKVLKDHEIEIDNRQELLIIMSADEEDSLPGFWNLFSNMEREDMERVATLALGMLGVDDEETEQ